MSYRFSGKALDSLMQLNDRTQEKVLEGIDEAAEEGFYGHEDYSFVYDHHGRAWDKLDLKDGELNLRIFFTRVEGDFYILEIMERDEIDYEEHGLYNYLKSISRDQG